MRPTDSVPAREPEFQLRCLRCGWQILFSGTAEITAGLAAAVREHRCPPAQPRRERLCIRCKKPIRELDYHCPYCGAANPLLPGE
jgi:DNA-directed RNA polymerase subunit RPC12/RpoP